MKNFLKNLSSGSIIAAVGLLLGIGFSVHASTITVMQGTDTLSSSRAVINTNFANLNTDKLETGSTAATLTITTLTSTTARITNASTTALSCLGNCAFGSTATTTINSAGNITLPSTGTLQFSGYSASPQLFASDSTTGIHFDGPGIITFHNSGAQTLTLSSTNKVGVGTSSPLSLFSVGTAGNAFRVDTTGTIKEGIWNGSAVGTLYGGTGKDSSAFTGLAGISSGNWYAISTSSPLNTSITGNASTVTTNANLSGVVTSSGNTTSWGSATAGVLATSISGIPSFVATSTLYGPALTALTTYNVGISSTTPTYRFSVNTTGSEFYVDSTGKTVGRDATNNWPGRISPTQSFVLGTGTTTTWTASTTGSAYSPFLVMPFAGTLRQVRCALDGSFLGVNVQVNGSNATPSYFIASSTIGTVAFTAGNTFTAGQKILANFGTTTTATTLAANCTFDATETP